MINLTILDPNRTYGQLVLKTAQSMGLKTSLPIIDGKVEFAELAADWGDDHEPDYIILLLGTGWEAYVSVSDTWLAGLFDYCCQHKCPLLIQSSSAIFNNESSALINESITSNPISDFGQFCLSVEQKFRTLERCLILRTGWIYSELESSWLNEAIGSVISGQTLDMPSDQFGQPTSANDLARVMIALIEQLSCVDGAELWDTYHYASTDMVSKNRFIQYVINEINSLVGQGVTLESTPYAQRPGRDDYCQNSSLDCNKILYCFGIKQRAWQKDISAMLKERFAPVEAI